MTVRIRSFDFAQDDNMDEIMSFTLNKSTVVNITTVPY